MNRLFILLLIISSCVSNQEKFQLLEYQEYKKNIQNKNTQLIDVRTPQEYELGHISGSVNIDFRNQDVFNNSFNEFDKSKPIFLYCRSGKKKKKSADILIEMGFSKVFDLKGGFIEWNSNELRKANF